MKIQAITFYPIKNFLMFNQKPRINMYNQGFDTFTFSGKHKTKAQIQDETEKIKEIMQRALDNNETITLKQMAQEMGSIAESSIYDRISKDKELKELWQRIKSHDYAKFSSDEIQEFEDAIMDIMNEAYRKREKIFIKTIAQKIGISNAEAGRIINGSEKCKKLYEKVKRRNVPSPNKTVIESKPVEDALLAAINSGKKISMAKLAQQLEIDINTLKRTLYSNENLQKMYDKVKNPTTRKLEESIDEIKLHIEEIATELIAENKTMAQDEIAQKANISTSTLINIINTDSHLNALLKQVRLKTRYSKGEVEKIDNFMHRFLSQKKEQGQKTTLDEIAQYLGISKSTVKTRIQENASLAYLWRKVKSINHEFYDEDTKKEQKEKIYAILKSYEQKGEKITREDLSIMANLTPKIITQRIENSPKLSKLWDKVKKYDRQFYSKQDVIKQRKEIRKQLFKSIESRQAISLKQISQITGIKYPIVRSRVSENEDLQKLWQTVCSFQDDKENI